MNHPNVIYIYIPGDGKLMLYGAHWKGDHWMHSDVLDLPEDELRTFIQEMETMGFRELDLRKAADIVQAGMSSVIPIILIHNDFPPGDAVRHAAEMHELMLKQVRKMDNEGTE